MALTVVNSDGSSLGSNYTTGTSGGTNLQPTTSSQNTINGTALQNGADPTYAQWASGAGGGGGSYYQAPDPYAQWGGVANFNNLRNQFNSGLGNARQSALDAFGGARLNAQGQAENLFNTIKTGQGVIDRNRQNIELNRMNGIRDILGFVRSGLQQGASRLSNMNALESSGAGALARAYQQIGNNKARQVGNQAFLQNREQDNSQDQLNLQRTSGLSNLQRFRDSEVLRIGSALQEKLQALNDAAIGQSLPDRIAIDQEKQSLINSGLSQLQEVDGWLTGQLGTVNPQNADQIRGEAVKLQAAGTDTGNPFSFGGTTVQQQFQGPALDQLPLFIRRQRSE